MIPLTTVDVSLSLNFTGVLLATGLVPDASMIPAWRNRHSLWLNQRRVMPGDAPRLEDYCREGDSGIILTVQTSTSYFMMVLRLYPESREDFKRLAKKVFPASRDFQRNFHVLSQVMLPGGKSDLYLLLASLPPEKTYEGVIQTYWGDVPLSGALNPYRKVWEVLTSLSRPVPPGDWSKLKEKTTLYFNDQIVPDYW